MEEQYNFRQIEKQSQAFWKKTQAFCATQSSADKFYCLSMFPYPSGALHVGHVRNYTIGDVIARFQRMNGKNVLQPIGWDAFGLPAEGAAIRHNTAPATWTLRNIQEMKKQLESLGFAFDWNRELITCSADYYRWEQWFFTQLYRKGLVYRKLSTVNWCPVDQTVLANEQVDQGRCWRCDTLVEKKELPQWFVKITSYAEELLNDLETLDGWPEQVKTMQRNWIGRSEGLEVNFNLQNSSHKVVVYTTRPDTLMGVTFLALAPEHPLCKNMAINNPELATFLQNCRSIPEADISAMEKKGMDTNLVAIHPISGDLIPVWVANFVLMEYGLGAVMSVPAHDTRDYEFAKKYQLPIRQVIKPENDCQEVWTGKGILINSDLFNGLNFSQACEAIANWLQKQQKGQKVVNYRLRDWGISRQRYWGAPIPMQYLADGEIVAVPDNELPVVLPEDVDLSQGSPLLNDDWKKTVYQGQLATRETDTFDTFFESSWYYARFCSPNYKSGIFDLQAVNYWLPVDQYVGGIEHACMHLLYARFFHKLLRDAGLVNSDEPFKRLLCQGMVLADSFYMLDDKGAKQWLSYQEIKMDYEDGKIVKMVHLPTGKKVYSGGVTKMSKSKNNGIDPQTLINTYGADTVRLYILFAAPPEQHLEWSANNLEGAYRFLGKIWRMVRNHLLKGEISSDFPLTEAAKILRQKIHATIKKVTNDMGVRHVFNTAIASIMELVNAITSFNDDNLAIERQAIETVVLLLSPVVPHICHIMWQELGHDCIVKAKWPQYNESFLSTEQIEFVVQVNGKVRAKLPVATGLDKDALQEIALQQENVQKFLQGKQIKKIIVILDKLVNIVTI